MRLWVGKATKVHWGLERQVIRLRFYVLGGIERVQAVIEHGLGKIVTT